MSVLAALALVLGGIALANGTDTGVPRTNVVTNIDDGQAVVDGAGATLGRTLGFGAAAQPQIDVGALIRSIVCPILDSLASGPFGAFIGPIIAAFRAGFGCTS